MDKLSPADRALVKEFFRNLATTYTLILAAYGAYVIGRIIGEWHKVIIDKRKTKKRKLYVVK